MVEGRVLTVRVAERIGRRAHRTGLWKEQYGAPERLVEALRRLERTSWKLSRATDGDFEDCLAVSGRSAMELGAAVAWTAARVHLKAKGPEIIVDRNTDTSRTFRDTGHRTGVDGGETSLLSCLHQAPNAAHHRLVDPSPVDERINLVHKPAGSIYAVSDLQQAQSFPQYKR